MRARYAFTPILVLVFALAATGAFACGGIQAKARDSSYEGVSASADRWAAPFSFFPERSSGHGDTIVRASKIKRGPSHQASWTVPARFSPARTPGLNSVFGKADRETPAVALSPARSSEHYLARDSLGIPRTLEMCKSVQRSCLQHPGHL